jgi:N-acetyl-anhydromuramoyl-L-alanine amidase
VPFFEQEILSPNFAPTPRHERRGVCFHHSVLDYPAAIARLTNPVSRVSYHLLIAPDGTRARLVHDDHVAWHAGVSTFQGRGGCNAFLLGVAFAGDTYAQPLTDEQIASALEWLALRWEPLGWSLGWMTDHRQVAPGRKDDLNPLEWLRLQRAIAGTFDTPPA